MYHQKFLKLESNYFKNIRGNSDLCSIFTLLNVTAVFGIETKNVRNMLQKIVKIVNSDKQLI